MLRNKTIGVQPEKPNSALELHHDEVLLRKDPSKSGKHVPASHTGSLQRMSEPTELRRPARRLVPGSDQTILRDGQTTGECNLTGDHVDLVWLEERCYTANFHLHMRLAVGSDRVDALDESPRAEKEPGAHAAHHDTDTAEE